MTKKQIFELIRGCCISDASAEEAVRRITAEPDQPKFPQEIYCVSYKEGSFNRLRLCRYLEDVPLGEYGVYKLEEVMRMYKTSERVDAR